ncbi:MAG: SCO family protein [Acidobacteriota bacterium]
MRDAHRAELRPSIAVVALAMALAGWIAPRSWAQDLPAFDLRNWDGRQVSAASLKGRTTIVAFTYAKCVFACPMITFRLKELDQELGSPRNLSYLHISVNPAEDTGGEILSHFEKHRIDPRRDRRWLFLNAPEGGIVRLLADFGVEVKRKEVKGGFIIEHTIQVLVVGRDGRTVASFDTYHWERKEMLRAVRSSLDPS